MEAAEPNGFLNVDRLLESSLPRPRVNLLWIMGGSFLLLMFFSAVVSRTAPGPARDAVGLLSGLLFIGTLIGVSAFSFHAVRQLRTEQQRVAEIGEMIQLRRWQEAAMALETYLSQPARTMALRIQALVYLAPVLVRLERSPDAIAVQDYLIDSDMVDAGGIAAMRIGRAVAMLNEDHLFDADRAISELRRGPAGGSAALALVELYRDVKTGHPAEAIELFERKLPELRDQLGQRVADAYALAARAYDLLGREPEARTAFRNATLLAPWGELYRRYPDVKKLADRFQPAPAPPEAA